MSGQSESGRCGPAPIRARVIFEFDGYDLAAFLPVAAVFGEDQYGYVATPNVDGLIRVYEDSTFRDIYAHATFVLLDSRIAAAAFRLVHRVSVPVAPGSDLTAALLREVITPEDRIVLIGSSAEQAESVRERYGLKHLIHHNPPMGFINDPAAVEEVLAFIERASPFRFCLVAVGDPQGTLIAHRLAERGRARGLTLIIGASIDFITGKQRRAPRWMQRCGLEWLHRLLSNPRRLARRYLIRNPRFFAYVSRCRVNLRPPRPNER